MYHEIILALLVSIDIYLISVAYCNKNIRIPVTSAMLISGAGAVIIGVFLVLSDIISRFISVEVCHMMSFILLSAIGIVTVFKSVFRYAVRKLTKRGSLSLKTDSGDLIIRLYLDDTAADTDDSHTLSAAEALSLALAGSLDCAGMGLSCGYNDVSAILTAVMTFAAGILAIVLGSITGKKISSSEHDFSWLGGAFLIAFAVFEFLH